MKKRLILVMLAVLTALCMAVAFAGCDDGKPQKPSDTTYTVTVQATENGSVTASAQTVKAGGSVTLTVTPDSGYVLGELKVNGSAVSVTGNTYTVNKIDKNVEVSATFKKQTVTVTFEGGNPATATVTVGEAYGELPPMAGTPGNRFIGWFTQKNGGGTQVLPTTVVTATENHTLYPYFTDKLIVTFDFGLGSGRETRREVAANAALGDLPEAQAPLGGILYGWFVGESRVNAEYVVTDDVTVRASYITAEIALAEGSGSTAVGGTQSSDVSPELTVAVKLDGAALDIELALETTDENIATVTDGAVVALADGEVHVKAMLGDTEVTRTDFAIACRSYAGYTAVTDKAGFIAIKNDKAGKYYLENDIDMQGEAFWDVASEYAPLFGVFTGVIDGMGHTVSNATAHPSGWNAGAFTEMNGTVRDIAFVGMRTESGNCANNGFFGNVKGVVSNVYLDIEYRYAGRTDGKASWGALASFVNNGAQIENCVVNLRSSVATDYIAAVAYNAGGWTGVVENVFVIKNGLPLTSEHGGMFFMEAADGVAAAQLRNSGNFDYLVQLWNSTDVDATKLSAAWSNEDGALYFHGRKLMDATPEYVIVPSGDVEFTYEDLAAEGKDQILYAVSFIHNGVAMDGMPENISTLSSNADVAELVYDEDEEVFVLNSKSAGTAVITIKVGDYEDTFKVTLTQILHITTARDFIEKIAVNPNGYFVVDADIDFADYNDGWIKSADDETKTIATEFGGIIDGNNHVLKNMKLLGGKQGGLFSRFSGTIKDLAFVNITGAQENNRAGLFYEMYGNGLLQNVYIDYVMQTNGEVADPDGLGGHVGPVAGRLAVAKIDGVIINMRFADGMDLKAIENIGAIVGHANAWLATVDNVKVIVNGIAANKLELAAAEAAVGVYASWTNCEQYADYADFLNGSLSHFTTDKGWTFDKTGITFGDVQVLAIPEYTVVSKTADITGIFAEDMDEIEIAVDVYNYVDKLGEYPDVMQVASPDEEVATVAVVDGKIVVTPLKAGEAVITVFVDDSSVEVAITLALLEEVSLMYDGETSLVLDYETAGEKMETSIYAIYNEKVISIPASVTLASDADSVASLVYNNETGKIDIVLSGEGTANLTAKIGDGEPVNLTVEVSNIYHIKNADEFRSKLAADLAGHFVLDNDINLAGGWGGKTDGTTFGDFSGILDGKGHKVSNFWLPGGWANGGMFHEMSGTIKNIAFVNAYGAGANVNCSGLFYSIKGGTVQNVYLDFEIQGAALEGAVGSGPLAYEIDGPDNEHPAKLDNVVINLRVAASVSDKSTLRYGGVVGNLCSWKADADNVKVILNGGLSADGVPLAYKDVTGTDLIDWWKGKGCAVYADYAAFAASDFASFDGELWTVDASGVTFGGNKVL